MGPRKALMMGWRSSSSLGFATAADPSTPEVWTAYDPAASQIPIFADPITTAATIRDGRCAELQALGWVR